MEVTIRLSSMTIAYLNVIISARGNASLGDLLRQNHERRDEVIGGYRDLIEAEAEAAAEIGAAQLAHEVIHATSSRLALTPEALERAGVPVFVPKGT